MLKKIFCKSQALKVWSEDPQGTLRAFHEVQCTRLIINGHLWICKLWDCTKGNKCTCEGPFGCALLSELNYNRIKQGLLGLINIKLGGLEMKRFDNDCSK